MHIPDILDLKTCVATGAVSVGAVAIAIHRVRHEFADRTAPLLGVTAACLFAAQMVNFPIPLLPGVSGHLLGGVLAATMLGPWGGVLVLAVVLAVQAVWLGDGGVSALGANLLNMGLIGSGVGYAIFASIGRLIGGHAGTVAGAVIASWFSVVLAAVAASVELVAGYKLEPRIELRSIVGAMLIAHSVIGVGEAIITGLAVSFVLRTRPDLIHGESRHTGAAARVWQWGIAGLAIALAVAVLLSPFGSKLPDGLEWSLGQVGAEKRQPLDSRSSDEQTVGDVSNRDLTIPDFDDRGLAANLELIGSIAAGIGTLVVFVAAFLLARGLRGNPLVAHTSDAAGIR